LLPPRAHWTPMWRLAYPIFPAPRWCRQKATSCSLKRRETKSSSSLVESTGSRATAWKSTCALSLAAWFVNEYIDGRWQQKKGVEHCRVSHQGCQYLLFQSFQTRSPNEATAQSGAGQHARGHGRRHAEAEIRPLSDRVRRSHDVRRILGLNVSASSPTPCRK